MCKNTIHQCEHCSKEIEVNSEWPNRRYCNRACYDSFRRRQIEKRANECKACKKPIIAHSTKSRAYCSMECRSQHAISLCLKECKVCSVKFSAIKWLKRGGGFGLVRDKEKKCCSRECLSIFMRANEERKEKTKHVGSNHPNWKGGSHKGGKRGADWLKIAQRCRELHGRVCKHCGKTELENGRKLDVNHIIPFHQHRNKTAANKQSNLEALCKSCHTAADWKYRKENPTQVLLDIFT